MRSEFLLTRKKKILETKEKKKSWRHCLTTWTLQKVIDGKRREVVIISRASHRAWQMWSLNASRTDTHRVGCCIRGRHWEDRLNALLFYSHPLQLLKVSGSASLELVGPFEYDHKTQRFWNRHKVVTQNRRKMSSESAQFGINSQLCHLQIV